jgi:hypothetical protein
MIIYSELTGRKYDTVEECVEAERKLKEEIQKEQEKRRKEKEELHNRIREIYKAIVTNWIEYLDLLEKDGYSVSDLEDKAIFFVEIINDAEKQKETSTRS